jgi:hypothetical protein
MQNTPTPEDLRIFLGDFPGAASFNFDGLIQDESGQYIADESGPFFPNRLAQAITQALSAFESETALKPLLVAENAAATTRKFRAVNGVVLFRAPLIHLEAVRIEGTPIEDLGWGFGLMPESEPVADWLTLDVAYTTAPGGVEVVGVWGAFTTLPEDVKTAILCRAALLFLIAAGLSPTLGGLVQAPGAVKKRKDEDVEEELTTGAEGGAREAAAARRQAVQFWAATYTEAVNRYRL